MSIEATSRTIEATEIFRIWLKNLKDHSARGRILNRIDRLALGNAGDHRNLKGGVSELRIDAGPGYRVYFTQRSGKIVLLLCGGTKKKQGRDIADAIRMVKELGD